MSPSPLTKDKIDLVNNWEYHNLSGDGYRECQHGIKTVEVEHIKDAVALLNKEDEIIYQQFREAYPHDKDVLDILINALKENKRKSFTAFAEKEAKP